MNTLQRLSQSKNVPHLLFYGPSDSGKSTAAFALGHELYGENYQRNFTYFNASDFFEKGKSYLVRDKRFLRILGTNDPKKIQKSVISIFKEIINEYASVAPIDSNYKIIFIDNSEFLDINAQQALRRIMEKYTVTCRFILSTTQPSKIISPLRSRGLQLFFRYVSDEKLSNFLNYILSKENINLTDDALQALLYNSHGNIAQALNTLQIVSLTSNTDIIDMKQIYDFVVKEEVNEIKSLFEASMEGNIVQSRKYIDKMLIDQGYTGLEILEHLHRVIIESGESDIKIARWTIKVAQTNFNMVQAANERIQLEALITEFNN